METDEPTRSIVEFVRTSEFSGLTTGSVHGIVRSFLDTVGCAAAGFDGEPAIIARQLAAGTSGPFSASAFGLPDRAAAEFVIFANGTAVRFRDWHDGGLDAGHPSDAIPALVATAEGVGSSVQELICAIFVAYEVVGALGKDRLFNGKGVRSLIISLAVAAGTGKLFRLSEDELTSAIGIALEPSIPLGIDHLIRRSDWKSMSAAHAAMTATFAVRLAKAGITGPPHVFDGKGALWEKVAGPFDLSHLGVPVDGRSVPERVSHKYFPSFTESQGPLAIVLDLRKEIDLDQLAAVNLRVTDVSWRQGAGERDDENRRWDPPSKDIALHSFPFLIAKALVDGAITIDSFLPDDVLDPTLGPLMAKVSVSADETFSERRKSHHEENAVVEFTMRDGRTISASCVHPRGHENNPMSDEELTAKFDGSVSRVLDSLEHAELRDRLWNLPEQRELSAITALFRKFANSQSPANS